MRDFYDITILFDYYKESINYVNLASAFEKTCNKRGTYSLLDKANDILDEINLDSSLQNLWRNYCKKYQYAKHIAFSTNISIIYNLIEQMKSVETKEYV